MYSPNVNPSQEIKNLGNIPPQSMSGSATAQTGWIDAASGFWVQVLLAIGAVTGGGTLAASWQQATSSSGAGAKNLTAGNFATQNYTSANANTVQIIEEHTDQLDITNGFRYVQLTLTQGTAAVLAAAVLQVGPQRYATATSPAS